MTAWQIKDRTPFKGCLKVCVQGMCNSPSDLPHCLQGWLGVSVSKTCQTQNSWAKYSLLPHFIQPAQTWKKIILKWLVRTTTQQSSQQMHSIEKVRALSADKNQRLSAVFE